MPWGWKKRAEISSSFTSNGMTHQITKHVWPLPWWCPIPRNKYATCRCGWISKPTRSRFNRMVQIKNHYSKKRNK